MKTAKNPIHYLFPLRKGKGETMNITPLGGFICHLFGFSDLPALMGKDGKRWEEMKLKLSQSMAKKGFSHG